MNTLITPIDSLKKESGQIQSFCEITMGEDMNEAVARGNDLAVYISRTGKMLADAKYWLNEKKKSETIDIIKQIAKTEWLSAKVQNSLIDSICREEQYLVDWIERLNKACTHQLEWCRSVVSKGKEELRLVGGIRG